MSMLTTVAQTLNADQLNIPKVGADQAMTSILNTAYLWGGIIAVIVIIIAGYVFVTSAGDAAGVKRAKNAIFYSAVGLIVIIMAFTITNFVIGRF